MRKDEIRIITRDDNAAVANIIRSVMPEFGASGSGFAIHDLEVDDMHAAYTLPRSAYYVAIVDNRVMGGGGIAPLQGGDEITCELKKMYFLPTGRGLGLGQRVLTECLCAASRFGYRYCYLETFNTMTSAMKLYEKNNFLKIRGPQGETGHIACDTFYQLDLNRLEIANR